MNGHPLYSDMVEAYKYGPSMTEAMAKQIRMSLFDMRERALFDAWKNHDGLTAEDLLDARIGFRGKLLGWQRQFQSRELLIALGSPTTIAKQNVLAQATEKIRERGTRVLGIAKVFFGPAVDRVVTLEDTVMVARHLMDLLGTVDHYASCDGAAPADAFKAGTGHSEQMRDGDAELFLSPHEPECEIMARNSLAATTEHLLQRQTSREKLHGLRKDNILIRKFIIDALAVILARKICEDAPAGRTAFRQLMQPLGLEQEAIRAAPWLWTPEMKDEVERLLLYRSPFGPKDPRCAKIRAKLNTALYGDHYQPSHTTSFHPLFVPVPPLHAISAEVLNKMCQTLGLISDTVYDCRTAGLQSPLYLPNDMGDALDHLSAKWTLTRSETKARFGPAALCLFWKKRDKAVSSESGAATRLHLVNAGVDPRLYTRRGPSATRLIAEVLLAAGSVANERDEQLKKYLAFDIPVCTPTSFPTVVLDVIDAHQFERLCQYRDPKGYRCFAALGGESKIAESLPIFDPATAPPLPSVWVDVQAPIEDILRHCMSMAPMRPKTQPPTVSRRNVWGYRPGSFADLMKHTSSPSSSSSSSSLSQVGSSPRHVPVLPGCSGLPLLDVWGKCPVPKDPLLCFSADRCVSLNFRRHRALVPISMLVDISQVGPSIFSRVSELLHRTVITRLIDNVIFLLETGLFIRDAKQEHLLPQLIMRLRALPSNKPMKILASPFEVAGAFKDMLERQHIYFKNKCISDAILWTPTELLPPLEFLVQVALSYL